MENKLRVSEGLMIGIDISEGDDISVMQIVRCIGGKQEIINTLYGEEAEWTYQHLINRPWNINLDKIQPTEETKELDWIKVNPGISRHFKPEFLNKPFCFSEAGSLSKLCLVQQRPLNARTVVEEMYPEIIKLIEKGEIN